MTKLFEISGKPLVEGAKFGIEIEAEGEGMRKIATQYWNSEDDGSLRGVFPQQRHEFVSTVIPFKEVEEALDQLIASQKQAQFDFSFRTSSHVHVNCTDMEIEAVAAFIYTYFLVEKDLMKYCGEHRNNNRFCLRMVDSDALVDITKTLIEMQFQDIRRYVGEDMRYGACNMAALGKYGTLEFRGMRGTLDKEVLLNWVGVLNNIREYAIQTGNTWNVYNDAVKDAKNFHKKVFGKFKNVFVTDETEWNLTEALSLTVDLPFTAKAIIAQPKKVEEKGAARKKQYQDAYDKAQGNGNVALAHQLYQGAIAEGFLLLKKNVQNIPNPAGFQWNPIPDALARDVVREQIIFNEIVQAPPADDQF